MAMRDSVLALRVSHRAKVQNKLQQDQDYPCEIVGSWNTWYGEQDQAGELGTCWQHRQHTCLTVNGTTHSLTLAGLAAVGLLAFSTVAMHSVTRQ